MEGASKMPNYRYSTPEYMRKNNAGRQASYLPEQTLPFASMPIAMAYVPWQNWHSIYELEKGLCHGTIFEELYKPFLGIGGCS